MTSLNILPITRNPAVNMRTQHPITKPTPMQQRLWMFHNGKGAVIKQRQLNSIVHNCYAMRYSLSLAYGIENAIENMCICTINRFVRGNFAVSLIDELVCAV